MPSKPACQAEACDLQSCLNKHAYQPEKCDTVLRQLYECCDKFHTETSGSGESSACPQHSVVQRWLRNHPKGGA
ncbi:hypothetical protein AGABI1DRAFT_63799 [Agaricus bisporus var. burnettii JB137-S8]|uniref:Cx9C motif-containing protein 4, mitochondrial n=1 Tax=Agaricus bisporus var. burnettii (strain JB137-S8 / ATCC MYA-4627 / FGSC 10392) TaxID=597362 RepID=K5VND1_AGABU|nr:hypothetical protein AGABI2DRAFT_203621 [Agaricus bisporus var. bisporus H97]XP_007333325.1 uncharacterized protein AGABI1DRAFT_63799 [Agaricus bisporus var. burnettii JB137-S8]EKM75969.1 hypothetical protein AGABI1DRAFT_63799 [Agaricus bisporus var. burnettii JB137-S8]EKV48688.1 hypothetical protein AGABI2DRAFT_203621 [Agaricus bisporus var. bisporus H97]